MQVSKYYEYSWLGILKLFNFNSTHITARYKIRMVQMVVQWKMYSPIHSCPNTSWVSWVSLGLFYLCVYLLLCIYYLFIVAITSKSVVKGPFTISRCLTRLCSPLSARILKSLFSPYSQSFRRTVEYNLGNLLATGLFKSWKKWPYSCFLKGATFPPILKHTFAFEVTKLLQTVQRNARSRDTRNTDEGETKGFERLESKKSLYCIHRMPVPSWI